MQIKEEYAQRDRYHHALSNIDMDNFEEAPEMDSGISQRGDPEDINCLDNSKAGRYPDQFALPCRGEGDDSHRIDHYGLKAVAPEFDVERNRREIDNGPLVCAGDIQNAEEFRCGQHDPGGIDSVKIYNILNRFESYNYEKGPHKGKIGEGETFDADRGTFR